MYISLSTVILSNDCYATDINSMFCELITRIQMTKLNSLKHLLVTINLIKLST